MFTFPLQKKQKNKKTEKTHSNKNHSLEGNKSPGQWESRLLQRTPSSRVALALDLHLVLLCRQSTATLISVCRRTAKQILSLTPTPLESRRKQVMLGKERCHPVGRFPQTVRQPLARLASKPCFHRRPDGPTGDGAWLRDMGHGYGIRDMVTGDGPWLWDLRVSSPALRQLASHHQVCSDGASPHARHVQDTDTHTHVCKRANAGQKMMLDKLIKQAGNSALRHLYTIFQAVVIPKVFSYTTLALPSHYYDFFLRIFYRQSIPSIFLRGVQTPLPAPVAWVSPTGKERSWSHPRPRALPPVPHAFRPRCCSRASSREDIGHGASLGEAARQEGGRAIFNTAG